MKKFFALLLMLVMLVSFAACDSQNPTMQKMIEANKTEKLLETYDSIYVHGMMDGELVADYYLTETASYEKKPTWAMYLTDDTGYVCSDGVYYKIVFLTSDGLFSYKDYRADEYADVVLSEDSLREEVQSVAETEDQITVTSVMNRKNLEKVMGEKGLSSYEATYVVDADTYKLNSLNGKFISDDGTTFDCSAECTYNVEMPEEIKAFDEYVNYAGDFRTVTLVFHVGTAKEKVEKIQVPKGIALGLGMPSNAKESFSPYADAACTEPHTSNGDYDSDVTIYIK